MQQQLGGNMDTQQAQTTQGAEVTDWVLDGLETIRMTRVTNMQNRDLVLLLAREWNYDQTADWIESVDVETYAELIRTGLTVTDESKQ